MTALIIPGRQLTIMSRAEIAASTSRLGREAVAWAGIRQAEHEPLDYLVAAAWNAASAIPYDFPSKAFSASGLPEQLKKHQLEAVRIWADFSQALDFARNELPLLIAAGPGERRSLAQKMLEMSHPIAVTLVAFQEYDQTGRECFLLQNLSLLGSWGPAAWVALHWIARAERAECELFTGLIARCPGVPPESRLEALGFLANNPSSSVRLGLFEHLGAFPIERVRPILEKLATDRDGDVGAEATERLQLLG